MKIELDGWVARYIPLYNENKDELCGLLYFHFYKPVKQERWWWSDKFFPIEDNFVKDIDTNNIKWSDEEPTPAKIIIEI